MVLSLFEVQGVFSDNFSSEFIGSKKEIEAVNTKHGLLQEHLGQMHGILGVGFKYFFLYFDPYLGKISHFKMV